MDIMERTRIRPDQLGRSGVGADKTLLNYILQKHGENSG